MYGVVDNWAGKNLGTTQITITGTKINYGTLSKWRKLQFLREHVTIKKMCTWREIDYYTCGKKKVKNILQTAKSVYLEHDGETEFHTSLYFSAMLVNV